MTTRLTAAALAAFLMAGCQNGPVLSTERPLFAEDYTPDEISARVAHLLDADTKPAPTIKRLDRDTWHARPDTHRGQVASGKTTYTKALYNPNRPAILLSPAADDGSLAHELAHYYGAGQRTAECVEDNWHADMPRGWCN